MCIGTNGAGYGWMTGDIKEGKGSSGHKYVKDEFLIYVNLKLHVSEGFFH